MMKENSELPLDTILQGDTLQVLKTLPDNSIDTIITSPPYWGLRDYGVEGQIGLEPTLDLYIDHLLQITAELKRVLKPTGVMFWNHGDSYATQSGSGRIYDNLVPGYEERAGSSGLRHRKLIEEQGIPRKSLFLQNYRLILRMIDEQGWILRNTIIWHKPNHMPSSVKDRFANAYEPVFMLTKNKKYFFDLDAVRVPHTSWKPADINEYNKNKVKKFNGSNRAKNQYGKDEGNRARTIGYWDKIRMGHPSGKNPGDLWTIPTQPFPEAHFATFPEKLVEPMIKAGCPNTGVVLDPFAGSGTTLYVARKFGRHHLGIELNPRYVKMAQKRLAKFGERLDKFIKI